MTTPTSLTPDKKLINDINTFVAEFQATGHADSADIRAIVMMDLFNFLSFLAASDGRIGAAEIRMQTLLLEDSMLEKEARQFIGLTKDQRQRFLDEPPLSLVLACEAARGLSQRLIELYGAAADIQDATDRDRSLPEEQDRAEYLYMMSEYCKQQSAKN